MKPFYDPKISWNPSVSIENGVGDVKSEVTHNLVKFRDEKGVFICETRKIKGTFSETFELNDFPV